MYSILQYVVLGILFFSSITAQPSPVITLGNEQYLSPLMSVKTPIPGTLSWSVDGRWLAAAASSGLRIIDTTDSDRIVHILPEIKNEALFGADGLTFTAERHLYNTLSGEIILQNSVGWADEEHRILYVNESSDTTSLYHVVDGEIGERIVTIPFAADRVIVASASPIRNGIFIREPVFTGVEYPLDGELTVWNWGGSPVSWEERSASAQMVYTRPVYEDPIVSISPDGRIAELDIFPTYEVISASIGMQIDCECYEILGFIKTEAINPREKIRFVVRSIYETPVVWEMEWDIDFFEWPVPATPVANDSSRISSWDFTNSYQFGAISAEYGIEIWQLDTAEPQQLAQIDGDRVYAISEDGKRVLAASADELVVWSLDDLSVPKAVIIGTVQSPITAVFDGDNASTLLIDGNNGYQVWNEQPDGAWTAGASSTERGNYYFAAQGRFVVKIPMRYPHLPDLPGEILDSRTGEKLAEWPVEFAVSPNGEALAIWDSNVLRIIDSATLLSRDVLTLEGVRGGFSAVNLPRDQVYINDSSRAVWDVYEIQTGEHQFSIPFDSTGSRPFFSADGSRMVFTKKSGISTVWDVSGVHPVLVGEIEGAFSYTTPLNDDGTLLLTTRFLTDEEQQAVPVSEFHQIFEIWDLGSGAIIHSIQVPGFEPAAFVPDTDLLLIQAHTHVEVWDIASQPAVRRADFSLDIDPAYIISMTSVDFNDDRTLALATFWAGGPGGGYGSAFLIPLDLQSEDSAWLDSLQVSMESVGRGAQFSADETYLVMRAVNYVREPKVIVYRLSDGAIASLPAEVGAMSPDETLLVTANPLRVWNVAELFIVSDSQPIAEYSEEDIEAVVFSEDGTLLYTWNNEGVTVWDADVSR